MRNKVIFALVIVGLVAGFVSAYLYGRQGQPLPPVFNPAPNPFAKGVYANGIVESYQAHGQNTNLYPQVAGAVTQIYASEGQTLANGDPILTIDESVQRATTEQLLAQALAAASVLEALRAQPRKEVLEVARAQVEVAAANVRSTQIDLDKQQHSYQLDTRSVSKQTLDNAKNSVSVAQANLDVATRQYELTKAGAWTYDIQNQQRQYEALNKAYLTARAQLALYTLRAPRSGVLLSMQASVGSYVSPQGVYDSYTQMASPIAVMGDSDGLAVRCYVDEILIPRLPSGANLQARMYVRGTNISVPLEFVRVQPYVSPKIQLSNARTEKVDLRVLPVIFRFTPPAGTAIYPGQLVDVYLSERPHEVAAPPAKPSPVGAVP